MCDPEQDRGFEDLLRAIDILSGTVHPDSSSTSQQMEASGAGSGDEAVVNAQSEKCSFNEDEVAKNIENQEPENEASQEESPQNIGSTDTMHISALEKDGEQSTASNDGLPYPNDMETSATTEITSIVTNTASEHPLQEVTGEESVDQALELDSETNNNDALGPDVSGTVIEETDTEPVGHDITKDDTLSGDIEPEGHGGPKRDTVVTSTEPCGNEVSTEDQGDKRRSPEPLDYELSREDNVMTETGHSEHSEATPVSNTEPLTCEVSQKIGENEHDEEVDVIVAEEAPQFNHGSDKESETLNNADASVEGVKDTLVDSQGQTGIRVDSVSEPSENVKSPDKQSVDCEDTDQTLKSKDKESDIHSDRSDNDEECGPHQSEKQLETNLSARSPVDSESNDTTIGSTKLAERVSLVDEEDEVMRVDESSTGESVDANVRRERQSSSSPSIRSDQSDKEQTIADDKRNEGEISASTERGIGARDIEAGSTDKPVDISDEEGCHESNSKSVAMPPSLQASETPVSGASTNQPVDISDDEDDDAVMVVEQIENIPSSGTDPHPDKEIPPDNRSEDSKGGSEIIHVTYNSDNENQEGVVVETLHINLEEDSCSNSRNVTEEIPVVTNSTVTVSDKTGNDECPDPIGKKSNAESTTSVGNVIHIDKEVSNSKLPDKGKTTKLTNLELEDMEDTFPEEQIALPGPAVDSSTATVGDETAVPAETSTTTEPSPQTPKSASTVEKSTNLEKSPEMEVSVIKLAKSIKEEKIDNSYEIHSNDSTSVISQPPGGTSHTVTASNLQKKVHVIHQYGKKPKTRQRKQVVTMGPVRKTTTAAEVGSSPSLQNIVNMNNQLHSQSPTQPNNPMYRVVLQGGSNPSFQTVNATVAATQPPVSNSASSFKPYVTVTPGKSVTPVRSQPKSYTADRRILNVSQPSTSASSSVTNGIPVSFTASSRSTPRTIITVTKKTNSRAKTSSSTIAPKTITVRSSTSKNNGHIPSSMLLHSPSQKYIPGAPPPGMDISDLVYYPCSHCDDIFLIEASLHNHMQRRSMLITYNCENCKVRLVFFNRCLLLEHMKKHYGNMPMRRLLTVPHLTNIDVEVLPEKYLAEGKNFRFMPPVEDFTSLFMKGKKSSNSEDSGACGNDIPDITARAPELASMLNQKTPVNFTVIKNDATAKAGAGKQKINDDVSITKPPTSPVTSIVRVTTPLSKNSSQGKEGTGTDSQFQEKKIGLINCPECKKICINIRSYHSHFNSTPTDPLAYRCSQCNMYLPSQCALSAHRRIHIPSGKSQVCPECGQIIRGNRSVFIRHLERSCFHFCRIVMRKCPACPLSHWDESHLTKHFMDVHSEVYHKCMQCPMAFKSRDNYARHNKESHNEDTVDLKNSRRIFKCPLCDTVFHQSDQLLQHLQAHEALFSKDISYGYKCPKCMIMYGSLADLLAHLRIHNIHQLKNLCDICGVATADNKLHTHMDYAHRNMSYYEPAALSKTEVKPSKVSSPPRVTKQLCIVLSPTDVSKFKASESDSDSTKEKDKKSKPARKGYEYKDPTAQPKPTVEDMFKNIAAEAKKTREEQDSEKTRKKNKFLCEICFFEFHNIVLYQDHLQQHKAYMKKKKRSLEEGPSNVMVKKPKIRMDDGLSPVSPGKGSPVKRQVNVETLPPFACSECEERFFEREQLRDHLEEEHCIQRQYICHICGNTYITESLLQKHKESQHEGKKEQRSWVFTCLLCEEKGIKKTFKMHKEYALKHIVSNHKIPRSAIDEKIHIKCTSPEKATGQAVGEEDKSKKNHDHSDDEEEDTPMKKLKLVEDTVFTCSKCCFDSDSRSEFLDHIQGHRTDRDSLQCRECGMCFASQPSLKKHLFILHKVRDFHKYTQESGQDLEKEAEETEPINAAFARRRPLLNVSDDGSEDNDSSSTGANSSTYECKVCYKWLHSSVGLRNHMRTHGMAFIRSKRTLAIESP